LSIGTGHSPFFMKAFPSVVECDVKHNLATFSSSIELVMPVVVWESAGLCRAARHPQRRGRQTKRIGDITVMTGVVVTGVAVGVFLVPTNKNEPLGGPLARF